MLWRFIIVRDNGTKKELSRLTHYGSIIEDPKYKPVEKADLKKVGKPFDFTSLLK